jgi:cyclopropane fatty-acyl-phospholipid synthase-like methyltransferase
MEDRIELIGGDFSTDSIGDNYDLIIASHVLYMTKNNMDVIMKKIYAALNPGGVFVSFHSVLTDEGTKPEKQVLSWLSTSMSEYNMTLDEEIISESALRVGFYSVKNSIDNEYTNIVIARKQRK